MIGKFSLPIAAGGTGGGGGGTLSYNLIEYTSGATWTKPTGLVFVEVLCIRAGGGGDGGERDTASIGTGGRGGPPGDIAYNFFLASDVGATETVVVGAGGAGGSGRTTDGQNDGSNGGHSSFGSLITTNSILLNIPAKKYVTPISGDSGTLAYFSNPTYWGETEGGYGGAGGDGDDSPSRLEDGFNGGAYRLNDGSQSSFAIGGTLGSQSNATDGEDGYNNVDDYMFLSHIMLAQSPTYLPGTGGAGGGGCYNSTGDFNAGNGGDGGFPGGAGGGGGGLQVDGSSTGSSGSGGNGANGIVYVLEYILS